MKLPILKVESKLNSFKRLRTLCTSTATFKWLSIVNKAKMIQIRTTNIKTLSKLLNYKKKTERLIEMKSSDK